MSGDEIGKATANGADWFYREIPAKSQGRQLACAAPTRLFPRANRGGLELLGAQTREIGWKQTLPAGQDVGGDLPQRQHLKWALTRRLSRTRVNQAGQP